MNSDDAYLMIKEVDYYDKNEVVIVINLIYICPQFD